ncbi:hypothetical protein [Eilatimonas milleporae]|uniref:hypothetical protein n=1 Tax=Eilatimonas milleporae TaxID=911205 RepID=UPI000EF9CB47|nr:hypothetical protein [Eilatimonas milleporae]
MSDTQRTAILAFENEKATPQQTAMTKGIMRDVHDGGLWLQCDCRKEGMRRPLVTVVKNPGNFLSWKIWTKGNRLAHAQTCAFHRRHVRQQLAKEAWSKARKTRPEGFFAVLKSQSKGAKPHRDSGGSRVTGERTRLPALARQLAVLIEAAKLNVWWPDGETESRYDQFHRLEEAAEGYEVAQAVSLAPLLFTKVSAWEKFAVHAKVRAATAGFPKGHRPQGFICFCTSNVDSDGTYLRHGRDATEDKEAVPPLRADCAGTVTWPSIGRNAVPGPYLFFGVVGLSQKKRGYELLKAYAQPVVGWDRLVPVDSHYERRAFGSLKITVGRLMRQYPQFTWLLHKPVFETITKLGPCLPDFEIIGYQGGKANHRFIVEVMDFDRPSYLAGKEITHPRMELLGPLFTMDGQKFDDDLSGEGKRVSEAILSHLRQAV